jgi:Uma2 family endonuclease
MARDLRVYGYEESLNVLAFDRNTKTEENEHENTDGPDIAQPTGEHGPPNWFLA